MAEQQLVSADIQAIFKKLVENEQVQEALAYIKKDHDHTIEEQIRLTEIEAPTFDEGERRAYFKNRLEELGLENIEEDSVGNVFGVRPGGGSGPRLVVCAHLDTVFPRGTDVIVKHKDGKLFAPGISDDGRGLASVLALLKVFNELGLGTEGDILFGATVGEEGLGDLRGVKNLFATRDDIDAFISIEPGPPTETTFLATGSRRYKITYKGPGGHSFGNFGTPSAIHALGRAIGTLADYKTPLEPKTTFNVGVIDGGTTVNTIAAEASMMVDMRSTSAEELEILEKQVLAIAEEAAVEENNRWELPGVIKMEVKSVGNRPAGGQPSDAAIVQAALGAAEALGFEPELDDASSTDSNVPISLGIPAVTLGGGGNFGGMHTLDEFFDPKDAYQGTQRIFLTILALVGGLTSSVLKVK